MRQREAGRGADRGVGFTVYGSLNMAFQPEKWIQPDVCVLHRVPAPGRTKTWVPADHFTMPVEFVSRSSRKQDRIDKPALCAEEGSPTSCASRSTVTGGR